MAEKKYQHYFYADNRKLNLSLKRICVETFTFLEVLAKYINVKL